jgi:type IV pilus assembly protein PilB
MSQCLNFPIDKKVLGLLPKNLALDLPALPLQEEKEGVRIALEENHSQQTVDDLAFLLGKPIIVEKYPSEELLKAIGKHYDISDAETGHVSRSSSRTELISAKEDQNSAPVFDGSIIPLVNRIVSDAIQMGASDIHVEPYEKLLRIRYRLDGALHDVLQPSLDKAKPLISRLKIMADLDIAEKRRPQDGRIRVRHNNHMIDIRVSTLPTDFGEKVVLRILDKSNVQLDLKKIGFEEEELEVFKKTIKLPYGMVLVTGPTGSGKTTTLYSALTEINSPDINITTIEDPIEYNLQGINQTHVRADIGLTFAATLRSIVKIRMS